MRGGAFMHGRTHVVTGVHLGVSSELAGCLSHAELSRAQLASSSRPQGLRRVLTCLCVKLVAEGPNMLAKAGPKPLGLEDVVE